MHEAKNPADRKWSPVWAGLLAIGAGNNIGKALDTGDLHHWLMGCGMVMAGIFACRHKLIEFPPKAYRAEEVSPVWRSVLTGAVLMMLGSAVVALAT